MNKSLFVKEPAEQYVHLTSEAARAMDEEMAGYLSRTRSEFKRGIFAAIGLLVALGFTMIIEKGCKPETAGAPAVQTKPDCKGVPECIDRFERQSDGRVVFNPPVQFMQPFDQCFLEGAAEKPECQ